MVAENNVREIPCKDSVSDDLYNLNSKTKAVTQNKPKGSIQKKRQNKLE